MRLLHDVCIRAVRCTAHATALSACFAGLVLAQDACVAEERAVTAVRFDDGRAAYVEPMSTARVGTRTVIAGEPMYVWRADPATPGLDTAHGLVGIVLEEERVSPLPRPDVPQGVVTDVRLLADGNDVAAVFVLADSSAVGARDPRVLGYWFGRTDGRNWHSLQRLPLPNRALDASRATRLVRMRDRLMIAVPYGDNGQKNVAVYTGNASGWQLDTLTTPHAPYVALGSRGDALRLYVVYPDSIQLPDINSLWLYEQRGGGWELRGRVIRGGMRPVRDPEVLPYGSRGMLTWREVDSMSGSIAVRAARLRDDGTLDTVATIARDIESVSTLLRPGHPPEWIAYTRKTQEPSIISFVEWTAGGPMLRDRVFNPYTGPLIATIAGGDVIAVGPVFTPTSRREVLVSGILRLGDRCSVPVPRVAP